MSKSVQVEIETIKNLMKKIGNEFEMDNNNSKKCHSFGSINVIEFKNDLTSSIQSIIKTLSAFETKISETEMFSLQKAENRTRPVSMNEEEFSMQQILKIIKDNENEKLVYKKLQNSLDNCRLIGINYLEKCRNNYFGKNYRMKDRLKLTVATISGFGCYEMEDDDNSDIIVVVIVCGHSINLDIRLKGESIVSVDYNVTNNLTFESEKLEDVSEKILIQLRERNFAEFENTLKKCKWRFDKLDKLEFIPNVKSMLFSVEKDLELVDEHESKSFGSDLCLTQYHGIIKKYDEGYYISFFNRQLENDTMQSNHDERELYYSALITIEQSAQLNNLALDSQIKECKLDGHIIFNQFPVSNNLQLLTLVLNILPPISITTEKFNLILKYGNYKQDYINLISSDQEPYRSEEMTMGESQYIFTISQPPQLIQIQRIPFTHISQILPILQILRQQLTINVLQASCFSNANSYHNFPIGKKSTVGIKRKLSQQSDLSNSFGGNVEVSIFEDSIRLKLDNQITISINVCLNGLIEVADLSSENTNFDTNLFAQQLNRTRLIPYSLDLALGKTNLNCNRL